MLQLVNNGNVALQRPGLEGALAAPLRLQLLSLELQHNTMTSFQAPSLHAHDKVSPQSRFHQLINLHMGRLGCGDMAS